MTSPIRIDLAAAQSQETPETTSHAPTHSSNNHQPGDQAWPHKWGFSDTQFIVHDDRSVELTGDRYPLCGRKLPKFIPHIEAGFGVDIDWTQPPAEVSSRTVLAPHRYEPFCQALAEQFPTRCISDDACDRLQHSHGQSTIEEVWKVLYGELPRLVDLVFYCESPADAQTVIQLAAEHNVCLVPYGGGTSVSSALTLPTAETRMIVSLDTQRMRQVEWIDQKNGRACVQAGITGRQLDAELKKVGFMSGHEPDSREFSTLGGWIATNASGMKKNRYGNIEDIVESVTMITPTGILSEASTHPRVATGISLQHLCFGSEGNLGLITKAIIRIRPLPEVQKYGSLLFPTMETGIDFLYALTRLGCIPASIRLVDNAQFRFSQVLKPEAVGIAKWIKRVQKFYLKNVVRFSMQEAVAATVVLEGSKQEVAYQEKTLYALAKKYKGIVGGASNGRGGYLLTYAVAYIGNFLMRFHILGETFETTVAWSDIPSVVTAVKTELNHQHQQRQLPGRPYINYRVTQVYPTGVCLYFTMALYMKGVDRAGE
ncbi:MAG: FAD-binding protein, partial [Cyanobacteria bacterium J06555_13]